MKPSPGAITAISEETRQAETVRQAIEDALVEERLENAKQDRALRKSYASQAFRFLYVFAAFSGAIIIAQGFETIPFKLPENVVVTLIGATAASVIGLVGFVARGLFKAPE
tara:strand:- start:4789 stop:5121 length:333 start_codon:yes stop_codon:yes gene_type:complete